MARVKVRSDVMQRVRMEQAMSQADVADLAGIRQATVSNAENGKNVRYATISAIAGALKVEVATLVEVIG